MKQMLHGGPAIMFQYGMKKDEIISGSKIKITPP